MHPVATRTEGSGMELKLDASATEDYIVMPEQSHSIEDDINHLFERIDIKTTRDTLRKSAMKRPIRACSSPASGIGISEHVSLKQALRGLCISQASEMAAMKRLSKPARVSEASESGTIKRLYRAVVVEANESGHPHYENKGNMVEISLVPERGRLNESGKISETQHISEVELSNQIAVPSTLLEDASLQKVKIPKTLTKGDEIVALPSKAHCVTSEAGLKQNMKMKSMCLSSGNNTSNKLPVLAEIASASVADSIKPAGKEIELKGNLHSASSPSTFGCQSSSNRPQITGSRFIKSVSKNKNLVKKKVLQKFASSSTQFSEDQKDFDSACSKMVCQTSDCTLTSRNKEKESASPASICTNISPEVLSTSLNSSASKAGFASNCSNRATNVLRADEQSGSREKGEFSQSSKSSIGEYSSSTSFSEESHLSVSSQSGNRPHMSKDVRWEAIRCVQKQHGSISLRHFKLLRKLGAGDIASVYLAELTSTNCLFALKVMDNELLASRKKLPRAQTEKEILQMLDHPFLPTLFSHFTANKYSCLVMEHCPGGDLHVLRQKQPSKSFSEHAARFYVSEVLLVLEYLHMLGVVYRDLKPENILVREDGHIMLSDFDLSLRCAANPTLVKSSSPIDDEPSKKISSPCSESSCIEPFCLHPSWQVPCFTPRFLSAAAKARKLKSDLATQVSPLPQLVVEPTSARSNSFVGTHEYLAPEIIKGEGHGSSVDWWTFGIFLYELLYGRTPFKGAGNDDTLANVVSQCLKFPASPIISSHARDLIRRLLKKEPENRLGSIKGAAEIKHHPFFEGTNWALIRCSTPPELPKLCDVGILASDTTSQNKGNTKCRKECKNTEEDLEFEMF